VCIKELEKYFILSGVADPGSFIPDPNIFPSLIGIQTFVSYRILNATYGKNSSRIRIQGVKKRTGSGSALLIF
jgi:hypothetical protein